MRGPTPRRRYTSLRSRWYFLLLNKASHIVVNSISVFNVREIGASRSASWSNSLSPSLSVHFLRSKHWVKYYSLCLFLISYTRGLRERGVTSSSRWRPLSRRSSGCLECNRAFNILTHTMKSAISASWSRGCGELTFPICQVSLWTHLLATSRYESRSFGSMSFSLRSEELLH